MIIIVVNNKGGTGKTTTAVNLASAFAGSGYRVLLVDLDSQASASLSLGVAWKDLAPSVADVLLGGKPVDQTIRSSPVPGLDLITGDIELANSDLVLANVPGRENLLAESLEAVRSNYDLILCDCPPSLSIVPINAFVAADCYIVPVTPEYLALEGLISLMDVIEKVKAGMGIDIKLLGILLTLVNPAARSTQEIIDLLRNHYGEAVFKTEIKRDVKLSEAPAYGSSIFEFAPKSRGAGAYAMLADEVLERCGLNGEKMQSAEK